MYKPFFFFSKKCHFIAILLPVFRSFDDLNNSESVSEHSPPPQLLQQRFLKLKKLSLFILKRKCGKDIFDSRCYVKNKVNSTGKLKAGDIGVCVCACVSVIPTFPVNVCFDVLNNTVGSFLCNSPVCFSLFLLFFNPILTSLHSTLRYPPPHRKKKRKHAEAEGHRSPSGA